MKKYQKISSHQNKEKQKWLLLFLLFFSLSFFTFCNIPKVSADSSPVGYWKFDETSAGSTVVDSSGNNNNGTPSGNPQPSTDVPSLQFEDTRSLSFDGSDDSVTVNNSSSVDISGTQITISAWVKTSTLQNDTIIAEKGGWGTGTYQLVLGDGGTNSYPKFNLEACTSPADYSTSIADGTWHHLLGMYDGTHLYIYVDGVLEGTSDCDANINSNSNPLAIGYRYGEGGHNFAGQIDDLRIYNRTLSTDEISELASISSDDEDGVSETGQSEAKISSWKAYQYTDTNKSCSNRLRLVIKGRHFDDSAKVEISGKEASSVDRQSSQKIVAKFCLDKLLESKADHKRKITVKNPDTDEEEADKQINLDDYSANNISSQNTTATTPTGDYFSQKTQEGARHIQVALNKLGYLDAENITGTYGSITMDAVKKFQGDNGIEATGFVGELTKAKLKEKM